jgi:hypothetical protein
MIGTTGNASRGNSCRSNVDASLARRHDRTFRYAEACGLNEQCRRLWVPALGRGFCAAMVDWAIPMPEDGSLALAARSNSR